MSESVGVFLSYSRNDAHAAVLLHAQLEGAGLSVFKGDKNIRWSDLWLDRLQEAVDDCDAFVVLVGRDALRYWLRERKAADTAFLLAIDQFEELFTFADPDERRRFDRLLATALEDGDCPLFVISTVRSDFLDRLQVPAASYSDRVAGPGCRRAQWRAAYKTVIKRNKERDFNPWASQQSVA